MHRIDGDGAVAVIPTAQAVGATVGFFAAEGVFPQTQVTGDWLNTVQEELRAIAVGKGGSLSKADNDQCWDVLKPAALSVEGRSDEAAAVTTTWRLAVIASDDATVGESTAGVVNAAVVASDSCLAKSFNTAVVGSVDSRAGDTGGNKVAGIVAGSHTSVAEGDRAAVVASHTCTVYPNTTDCAIIGAYNSGIDEGVGPATTSRSVICGGELHEIYADHAFIGGGSTNEASGLNSGILGGAGNTTTGTRSAIVGADTSTSPGAQSVVAGGAYNTADGTSCAVVAGQNNTTDANWAATVGGYNNTVEKDGSVIIGSAYSEIPSTASGSHVVMLASKYCDHDLVAGTDPGYAVVGGYHASTPTAPSWRIQSNGGTLHATNTNVQGLDYAEWFENGDGTPHEAGELLARRGKTVVRARPGDRLLGVYSVAPTVLGGDDALGWRGMYARDLFGRELWEDAVETLKDGTQRPVRQRVLNPEWDRTRKHVPRSQRPTEHTPVGLVGQLRVRVDATVQAEDEVVASDTPGVGTRGTWVGRGAQVECMEIVSPFDEARGYAIALCLVR